MKKSLIISLYILLACFLITPQAIASDSNKRADKVIIYMIDNLSLNDINSQNTPYLWYLQEKGGVGLLNTITGGERTIKNACSTISAGKLAVGSNSASLNYKADTIVNNEKIGDVFFRKTGTLPNPDNIVVTNIEVIHTNNIQRKLGKPGKLGDSLHSLGLKTAVVGNSDRFDIVDRPGALILMNSKGIVDQGFIEKQVSNNEAANSLPNPYWTDYAALLKQVKSVQDSDVILIEYGDLTRLEAMHSLYSTAIYNKERKRILSLIDNSIKDIDEKFTTNDTCRYVISPSPSRNAYIPNALLTPVIIIKSGDNNGILTSYSTRRDGIVLLTSLTNSILNCFNTSVKDPIYITSYDKPYDYLKELNKRAAFSYAYQKVILTLLISCLLLLILGTVIVLLKNKNHLIMSKLLPLILSLPLALLIMPILPIFNPYLFTFTAIILCFLLTLIVTILSKIFKINSIMLMLILTIFTISIDLVLGLDLIAKSIMSYQIISGARYYGLGNEYMGVFIGATISLAAFYLNDKFSLKRLRNVKILFALVVLLIAYPLFGINVGGTITACVALGLTLIALHKNTLNYKDIISVIVSTALVISVIALLDVNQPSELQSHLGKNISLIADQGIGAMLTIIIRKLEMHLQIINYKYLGWILLALMIGITILIYKPNQFLIHMKTSFSYLYKGLEGIIIAAIIAFIFNDSGITAAATLSIYFICLLIYTVFHSKN